MIGVISNGKVFFMVFNVLGMEKALFGLPSRLAAMIVEISQAKKSKISPGETCSICSVESRLNYKRRKLRSDHVKMHLRDKRYSCDKYVTASVQSTNFKHYVEKSKIHRAPCIE
jgi:hypothetical protein